MQVNSDGLNAWLLCMCFVTFDLELGPSVEHMFPHNKLSPKEQVRERKESERETLAGMPVRKTQHELTSFAISQLNICNLCFPDAHTSNLGDFKFCFRTRREEVPVPPSPPLAAWYRFVFLGWWWWW